MTKNLLTLFRQHWAKSTGLILCYLVGCKTPQSLPEDPLFNSRTPIEVKARAGPPVQLASTEPTVPIYLAGKDAVPAPNPQRDGQPTIPILEQPTPISQPRQ